jgi:protein-tyrosine phosphatase
MEAYTPSVVNTTISTAWKNDISGTTESTTDSSLNNYRNTTTTNPNKLFEESVMPHKRAIATGIVDCRWLYNHVQASRGIILIDVRPREQYDEDTIPSSISIPPILNCLSLEQVEANMLPEQTHFFSPKKRRLRDIVLFGAPINERYQDRADCWLGVLEKLLVADGLVSSVKSLLDGFLTFKYRYPFYTTSSMLQEISLPDASSGGVARTQSGTHSLNYPNEILEGFLFLGNMWHAQSSQVIEHLGITHIVNATLDIGNVFESKGVKYHEVKIKDRVDTDIRSFFETTYDFIEQAKRTQHGRVLVHCTQGISRSATLVIMYLMRSNHWSLVTAVNFALASRGVVYPNEGFMNALMEEESRLYNGNSITHDELDDLLQHIIPDRPVPIEMHQQSSEKCLQCERVFSLLDWRHKCTFCKRSICNKCSGTKLAITTGQLENRRVNGSSNMNYSNNSRSVDESHRHKRVCDSCITRLWQINLPMPRKNLLRRSQEPKKLIVNSLSTYGKPVHISYYEGTESQVILDVIKTRFEVKVNQIVDISLENGEPVRNLAVLPNEASVLVSIGKAGDLQAVSCITPRSERLKNVPSRISGRQVQQGGGGASGAASQNDLSTTFSFNSISKERFRCRVASQGHAEEFRGELNISGTQRRSSSWGSFSESSWQSQTEEKFTDLWRVSFPMLQGEVERADLLMIAHPNPSAFIDLMLAISCVNCGTLNIHSFQDRLVELGYSGKHLTRMLAIVKQLKSSYKEDEETS